MLGCYLPAEEEVIRRLSVAGDEAENPFLMPGILIELERPRHIWLVDHTVQILETKIYDLDNEPDADSDTTKEELDRKGIEKRDAWLDTTFLKKGLDNWKAQLNKLVAHIEEFSGSLKGDNHNKLALTETKRSVSFLVVGSLKEKASRIQKKSSGDVSNPQPPGDEHMKARQGEETVHIRYRDGLLLHDKKILECSYRIQARVNDVIDEYDEKIRDCTMRLDGMAMATQWVKALFQGVRDCSSTSTNII